MVGLLVLMVVLQGAEQLVLVIDENGNRDIYTLNIDGTNFTRLTTDASEDIEPAWDPNRQQIAFSSNRTGNFEIYLMSSTGGSVRQLTDNNEATNSKPNWSPDGRYIVFESSRSRGIDLFVIQVNGEGVQQLTQDTGENRDPAWSPDGRQIAFSSDRDGSVGIYLMNTDGSGQTRVSPVDDANHEYPEWSPDGRQIAYAANRGALAELILTDPDGQNLVSLVSVDQSFLTDLAWSPDGTQISYVVEPLRGVKNIFVVGSDGFSASPVTTSEEFDHYNVSWASPVLDTQVMINAQGGAQNNIGLEGTECNGALPSRMTPGMPARISVANEGELTRNRLRNAPSTGGRELGMIEAGSEITIVAGPQCGDGYAWYQVQFDGGTGWTAEGNSDEYWIEPLITSTLAEANRDTRCFARTTELTNLRSGPGTTFGITQQVGSGLDFGIIGYSVNNSNNLWWVLDNSSWVRNDIVSHYGECAGIPLIR